MGKECSTCKFSKVDGVHIKCVRYPPTVVPIQSQNQLTGDVNMSVMVLPINVAGDYWCGEYDDALALIN